MDQNHSLYYLDDFVGNLACAPDFISMQMFPNAKELTETVGAYENTYHSILSQIPKVKNDTGLSDCIVCVGDGMTPRTAAMFAYRTSGWECFSIDPILREGATHTNKEDLLVRKRDTTVIKKEIRNRWSKIAHLHFWGECIQDVRLRCRRLILVMVHCHVGIEDCLRSIDCQELCGCICIPCCNFFEVQSNIHGLLPSKEYRRYNNRILSDKNLVRIWDYNTLCKQTNIYYDKPNFYFIPNLPIPIDIYGITKPLLTREKLLLDSNNKEFPWEGETVYCFGFVRVVRKFGEHLYFMGITRTLEDNKKQDINLKFNNLIVPEKWNDMEKIVSTIANDTLIYVKGKEAVSRTNTPTVNVHNIAILAAGSVVRSAPKFIYGVSTYDEITQSNEILEDIHNNFYSQ
ncbi:hypothetical protein WA158_002034 [Blastocystis sp. Blastoise]